MWYRWAEHTRFVFINQVHTIIRKHAASLTATDPLKTRIDGIAVQSSHFRRLRPRLSRAETAAAALHVSELQFHVAYALLKSGQRLDARRWFHESWKTRPTTAAALGIAKAFLPGSVVDLLARVFGRPAK